MAVFIACREGIWPSHNLMRAPIIIDSEGYPEGYPRGDYNTLEILHDGETWFLVKVAGNADFEQSLYDVEILTSDSLRELIMAIYYYAGTYEGPATRRSTIAENIVEFLSEYIDYEDLEALSDENVEDALNIMAFNHRFALIRPTKREIIERGLRP